MLDSRINLKNRPLAAVLAFLIPGAGHFYQGRLFKAVIYFLCILGLHITGVRMAEGKAVYVYETRSGQTGRRARMLQFMAQAGVGIPAICAIVQSKRFFSAENHGVTQLDAPLTAPFEGTLRYYRGEEAVAVSGILELEPAEGQFGKEVRGRFTGNDANGDFVEAVVGEKLELAPPIGADRRRNLTVSVTEKGAGQPLVVGKLEGGIPRPVYNWYGSPVDEEQVRGLHRKLGRFHELAMVCTWIAGLLNILAIWDAFDGPAYGYGDETDSGSTGGGKSTGRSRMTDEKTRAAAQVAT